MILVREARRVPRAPGALGAGLRLGGGLSARRQAPALSALLVQAIDADGL